MTSNHPGCNGAMHQPGCGHPGSPKSEQAGGTGLLAAAPGLRPEHVEHHYDLGGVTREYERSMLWACTVTDDETGEVTEADRVDLPVHPDDRERMREDVRRFLAENHDDIQEALAIDGYGRMDQVAHDFALTRNECGAGFWDRGLGEVGDRLTAAAQKFRPAYFWVDGEHLRWEEG